MQVRKFEAKTMKEALEMVKTQLGPEAIILSARDNSRHNGLMGQRSVEVTAAISDELLQAKQRAEAKLSSQARPRFQQSTARAQKRFIHEANRPQPQVQPQSQSQGYGRGDYASAEVSQRSLIPRPLTQQRYADISDAQMATAANQVPNMSAATAANGGGNYGQNPQVAQARIKNAAKLAFQAGLETMTPPSVQTGAQRLNGEKQGRQDQEIVALKNEIQNLKSLLEKFSQVPQNFLSLHPGADFGIPFDLSSTFEKMIRAGFSEDNSVEILKEAQRVLSPIELKKPAHTEAWLVKFLLDHLKISENRYRGFYHVFLGPAGQGKTSTLVKFASHLVMGEKKRIAIVTTDSLKVGAAEQLKIYAQILNIPFAIVKAPGDWTLLEDKLKNFDHVLVDAPGFQLKNPEEIKWMSDRMPPLREGGRSIHYVQSVLAKDEDAFEIASRYGALGFQDTIFTGLDESTQHGLIYNFQKRFGSPLHSFGIGPQMPEDFEPASKERVVDLIFKISKLRTRT